MKQIKGSMRRKQESLSKKNEDTTDVISVKLEELKGVTDADKVLGDLKELGFNTIDYGDYASKDKAYAVLKHPNGMYVELDYTWERDASGRDSYNPDEVLEYEYFKDKAEYEDIHGYSPRESKQSKKNEDTTEIAGMSVERGSIAKDVLDWADYEAGEGDVSVKDMLSELQEKGVRSGITFLITREDGVKFFDEHKQEINKILGDYIYNINGGPFTYQGWDEEDPLALNENNQDCLAAFAFEQVALDLLDKMGD